MKKGETFNPTFGINALDKENGDISYLLKVSGEINTEKLGMYNINYSVVDSDSNKITFIRKVLVKSDEIPKILETENLTLNVGDYFDPMHEITAIDSNNIDLTSSIIIEGYVDTSKEELYKLTYKIKNDDKELCYFTEILIKSKEEIPSKLPISNEIIREPLKENLLEKIKPNIQKQYENFDLYKNEPSIKTGENKETDESLPRITDIVPKDEFNNLQPFEENKKIRSIKIRGLTPKDTKPICLWLLEVILLILGKKLKDKKE